MGNFCSEMFCPPPFDDKDSRRSRRNNELFIIPEINAKFEYTDPDETPSEIADTEPIEMI